MKISMLALCGIGAIALSASADFLGWTSNVRSVSGGYLVNVFAVTDTSSDVILNVFGGTPGTANAGFILTNSPGGFLQGAGTQSVFAPSGSQSWTTLDSFLTVGGSFNTTSGAWTGNSATAGDPLWTVGGIDTFNTPGYGNANNVPFTAGWYVAGSSSPARSLASLNNRVSNSSAAAAAGSFGMLVAHLYIADAAPSVMLWDMQASVRRANGSISQDGGSMTVQVPAPGVLAVLALGGSLRGARRRR
jgi:hypothetical protein